jgi:hypothetical protein
MKRARLAFEAVGLRATSATGTVNSRRRPPSPRAKGAAKTDSDPMFRNADSARTPTSCAGTGNWNSQLAQSLSPNRAIQWRQVRHSRTPQTRAQGLPSPESVRRPISPCWGVTETACSGAQASENVIAEAASKSAESQTSALTSTGYSLLRNSETDGRWWGSSRPVSARNSPSQRSALRPERFKEQYRVVVAGGGAPRTRSRSRRPHPTGLR